MKGSRWWSALEIVAVVSFVLLVISISSHIYTSKTSSTVVQIGGEEVSATIADTENAREKGLGGRTGLATNEGMLFVFDSDGTYGFWMKDMSFSIDIVWIAADKRIVDVRKSVSPATYPEVFVPRAPARYVLELPSGFMDKNNVKIGDGVLF